MAVYTSLFGIVVLGLFLPSNALPLSTRKNVSDVHFLLWTRENLDAPEEIIVGDSEGLSSSYFKKDAPTKIFAHGWNGQPIEGGISKVREAYLTKEDCNFVSVDWSALQGINYIAIAIDNVPIAGNATGALIDFLVDEGTSLDKFHVMGFSLGAHVAGFAGYANTKGTVPRVTGLDPAWPFFTLNNTEHRLDPSDADFVDVIHTKSGSLIEGGLSFLPAVGDVDFYPNGGQTQPGCFVKSEEELADISERDCDHSRAVYYFAESINSEVGFRGIRCDSWEEFQAGSCSGNEQAWMGEPVSKSAQGTFYLSTNDAPPFAMG